MDLWIRTQRKRLCQIIDISEPILDEWGDEQGYCLYGGNLANTFISLAMYKTKERALEVLDEIQLILTPRYQFDKNNQDIKIQVSKWDYYVYEMPEE